VNVSGLQNRRVATIDRMSVEYLRGTPTEMLHGVGTYAFHSYQLFCRGLWKREDVDPADSKLKEYQIWREAFQRKQEKVRGMNEIHEEQVSNEGIEQRPDDVIKIKSHAQPTRNARKKQRREKSVILTTSPYWDKASQKKTRARKEK